MVEAEHDLPPVQDLCLDLDPSPQVAVQGLQFPQLPSISTAWDGQSCWLHLVLCFLVCREQVLPPLLAFLTTLVNLSRDPSPHDTLQADHSLHSLRQFTGLGDVGHSLFSLQG